MVDLILQKPLANNKNKFSHVQFTKPGGDKKANMPALINEIKSHAHELELSSIKYEIDEDYKKAIINALERSEERRVGKEC